MTTQSTPTEPFADGRDKGGRFTKGNPGGPGNPHAQHVARLRTTMLAAVSTEDIREVVTTLLALAKTGDVAAIREVFLRTLGRPTEPDMIERLERVEELLQAREAEGGR